MSLSNTTAAVAALIEQALEKQQLRPEQIAGQLAGTQLAPATDTTPGAITLESVELNLGTPAFDGYVLSSSTAGVRLWIPPGASLSDATPATLGTAAAGVGAAASRDDHVHALPTAAEVGAVPATGGTFSGGVNVGTAATATTGSVVASNQSGGDYMTAINTGIPTSLRGVQLDYDASTDRARIIVVHQTVAFKPLELLLSRLYLPLAGLRVDPVTPEAGEVYRDASGFLKIGL